MKYLKLLLLIVFISTINISQSQTSYKNINAQVWDNFTKAFETLDYKLFGDLHSKDMIRINGDNKSIKKRDNYIEGYKTRWQNLKRKQTISFRFLERIVKDSLGSERGIYKLTIHPNSENETSYYGKFHVLLRMENSHWKILVDYDSTENNTINEEVYQNAFAMDDFDKY